MATAVRDDRGLWKRALITVPTIVIIGSLMGYLSNSGFSNSWYANLVKPAFQPPGWAFGVVWTALYTMLGIALAAILNEPPSKDRTSALWLFFGQLALNFAWSPIFFGMRMIDVALVTIIVMLVMALAAARYFRGIRAVAGWLMLPYLAWLCLATALNYETGKLNPGADAAPLGITGA
ncbi:TspO/MBR family protein [Sphingomonas edaphi]|uniref:Tryptophan-rich sensory protein n=1 Tax=Sphingomonas edaphi TaxID=2315689 RepID=A0A418PZ29_9SPHN|nr:TspO/MBR family protein [Sphingomonas edaphi]RIX27421.1 tryptophan-rich sensory protein [Sphingomonas edaphi]